MAEWRVVVPDMHPGYIDWEGFKANQKRLGDNARAYPFHPAGSPERLRTSHLAEIRIPTLICEGTRDKLGSRREVEGYALSERIELFWLEDGDHDLKPRKRVSGETHEAHLGRVAQRAAAWIRGLD